MSYGVVRGRSQFSTWGGALLAVTGLMAGCDDTSPADDGGDAAADGDAGVVSAHASEDAGTRGIDTQDLSVGLDTSQPPDHLSVGLDSRGDAGPTDAGVLATSAPPSLDTSSVGTSSADQSRDAPDVDTTGADVDTTGAASSSNVDSSTAPPPELFAEITASATWTDLPVTFAAVSLPAVDVVLTWSVKSVPAGSYVRDAVLSDAGAEEVSFEADVAGTYKLNLNVASGDASVDVEASVDVANVEVAYLRLSNGPDGAYVYEPSMVASDGTRDPVVVGCPFDTWQWEDRDTTNWRDALLDESRTLGFRYPKVPGGETLFAYHYRADNNAGVTHVATVSSDCGSHRPVDLDTGFKPDFSPSAAALSRIANARIPYVLSSPTDVNTVVTPSSRYVAATAWWDETSILWAGAINDGEADSPAIGVSSLTGDEYEVLLDCAPSRVPTPIFQEFDAIDEVAIVPGGLMVLARSMLWYLPVFVGDGVASASCEFYDDANVLVATDVADFEVAPDGGSIAFLAQQYEGDERQAVLAVGPIGETFTPTDVTWGVFDVGNPSDYYTGLHWIDSQQLVWTAVQYIEYYEGGYNFTWLYDSSVNKINADGTWRRTLVYNAAQEGYPQSVITTGPIGLRRSYPADQ